MNKIRFYPFSQDTSFFAPPPTPASKFLPEWYRNQKGIIGYEQSLPHGVVNATVKKCMPVFDILTAGYIIVSPCDIYLDATDPEKLIYSIPQTLKQFQGDMFATHAPEQYSDYPIDHTRFHKTLFRVMPFWSVGTPDGYSAMFCQPFHREDSGLFAIGATVDTDKFVTDGHLSFLVEKDFKGVIKQGTPLIQVIPFKREDWNSEVVSVKESSDVISRQRLSVRSMFANGYKDKFRSRKDYK